MPRFAAALIALVAWIGLGVQYQASFAMTGGDPVQTAWVMLRYFTILTNLVVAIVMSLIALGRRVSSATLGGVTLAIMLVGVVYVTLLRGLLDLSGGAKLADTLMHYATPVLVPLWWLMFAPKGKLEWRDPAIWSLFPLAYFPYALARGAYEGIYAYPFINVTKIGWTQVGINAVMIAGGFLVAGNLVVALDGLLGRGRRRR